MIISDLFDKEERFKKLARRRDNFRLMCEHAFSYGEDHGICQIIETGTAWVKDCWEGQGQSTLIWDWLAKRASVDVLSIDLSEKGIETAKSQTEFVKYICGDSVKVLSELPKEQISDCGLLYLDSYDWTPQTNLESSFHHMSELASVYSSLPFGCMIVVDDRHGNMEGKHWMVDVFLSQYLKLEPVFRNHQIGFIKK